MYHSSYLNDRNYINNILIYCSYLFDDNNFNNSNINFWK